jgi:tagatose 6-phosphate kinase
MILCIGTTPAAQRVMRFKKLELDAVNRAAATFDGIAGKSINVAKVLKSLGARPMAMGFLGGVRGQEIRRVLKEKEIEFEFISVPAPTRECITVINETTGAITELVEESAAVPQESFEMLEDAIRRQAGHCRAMIMSGTITAGGPPEFYAECVRIARERNALAVVDAQGAALQLALAAKPGLVKPNRRELEETIGRRLEDEQETMKAMRQLREAGAERVVITAGNAPALAFDGAQFWRVHAPRVQAVNPIGSGDAFTAAVAWRLLAGDSLGEACRWGTAAGAANALTWMPGELEPDQARRLVSEARAEGIVG